MTNNNLFTPDVLSLSTGDSAIRWEIDWQDNHQLYRTRAEGKQDVFEYIEVFYNRQRRHSTLGYLSPQQFEQLWLN